MSKQHIAKSGAQQGKWVACSAEQTCRNGGTHISKDDLIQARALQLKNTGKLAALPTTDMQSVAEYQMLSPDEKKEIADFETQRVKEMAERSAKRRAADERNKREVMNLINKQPVVYSPKKDTSSYVSTFNLPSGKPLNFKYKKFEALKRSMTRLGISYEFVNQQDFVNKDTNERTRSTVDAIKINGRLDAEKNKDLKVLVETYRIQRHTIPIARMKPIHYEHMLKHAKELDVKVETSGSKIFGFMGTLKSMEFDAPTVFEGSGSDVKILTEWVYGLNN